MPAPGDVHAALGRISASKAFASSDRACRLLAFLVERTIEGAGDSLKEYVVGREVFDRPEEFDPRLDSIVRVEVRRLRSRLDAYYRGEGAADPVMIHIPRGTYRPDFRDRATAPAPAAAPRASRPARRLVVSGAIGVAAVAAAVWFVWPILSPPAPARPVSVAVLPFTSYSSALDDARLAARISDGVTTELASFRALSVVSRTSASQFSDRMSIPAVARQLGADLVMEGSVVVEGPRVRVTARLVDGRSDRKVWVGQYEVDAAEIAGLERRIAIEAAPACLASAAESGSR